ncbi:uncharacterized protein LOC119068261 [Bradysia coprophila]|uniref:uncharacterized protein LOC119068261 n=1 Tax=Bradysia coprophila TaxID=38358 RepID=UPI00187D88A9|nr:uncharacterized protein LOC119068261 [Bradysia coprophila]
MQYERIICCCGASTWTKVMAWFQIVGNFILIIVFALGIAGLITSVKPEYVDIPAAWKNLAIVVVATEMVVAIVGFIMGIILLIGTKQKRLGFLRACLIYAGAAILILVAALFISAASSFYDYSVGYSNSLKVVGNLVGIFAMAFCFVVIHIHIREIRGGVFME